MEVQFLSLASGSSGNSYYLGTEHHGILIDAGISPRKIKKALTEHKIQDKHILAVFVTHDHADHIKAVGTLGEKWNIPIYATKDVHKGIRRSYCVTLKPSSSVRYLEKGEILFLEEFRIEPFEVPHDSTDNVGYYIEVCGQKIVFITDMGYITSTVEKYVCQAEYIVIEANYDLEMLKAGPYPVHLKKRIIANSGHMDNLETGRFLADHFQKHWKHVWLCHLSKDNNTPQKAYNTLKSCLSKENIQLKQDLDSTILRRDTPSEMFYLK